MVLRLIAAAFAVLVTGVLVFVESVLYYAAGFDVRGGIDNALYDLFCVLMGVPHDSAEAMITVLVYTLPEVLLAMGLYVGALAIARAMGHEVPAP